MRESRGCAGHLPAVVVRGILERVCRQRGLEVTAEWVLKEFASLQVVDLI